MASQKIKGKAIVNQYAHKSGGSRIVLEKFSTNQPDDLLKRLAVAKPKNKELVTVIIEPVQKTLIEE